MALRRNHIKGVANVITRAFRTHVDRKYSASKLRNAARVVASAEIDMIRQRTSQGLDRNGKPFRPLSANYQRWKRAFIANGYKTAKGKRRGSATAFAADRAGQFLRLTGRTFSDMYIRDAKVTKTATGYLVDYTIDFKTSRSKKIAEYHQSLGVGRARIRRPFLGAAKGTKNDEALRRAFINALK